MTVKHRFALFLDLEFPPLLGILHFVQHIGTTSGTSQHIMSICKRLVILECKKTSLVSKVSEKHSSLLYT